MKKRAPLFDAVIVLVLFALGACTHTSSQEIQLSGDHSGIAEPTSNLPNTDVRLDMNHTIEFVALLESYDERGWTDHYVDGSYAIHKISVLRIVEPIEYEGKFLNIRHDKSPEADSVWCDIDVVFRLKIAEDLLKMMAGEAAFVGTQDIEIVSTREKLPDEMSE